MTFIFDENLSAGLVRGLKEFGEDVQHLTELFKEGTPDEIWLRYLGENGLFLITRDKAIRRRPIEKEAIIRFGVGAFFLGGKKMSRWQIIRQVILIWHRVKEKALKTDVPFAYLISRSGRQIENLHLD